ncbi:hypothetical protein AmDm5_3081 [Acetobacter malorum]|nr:hypothetical protein AmDm5_3081 [Acetobacter malorum]
MSIILGSAKHQVIRIAANGIVAKMHYNHTFWDGAVFVFKGYPMSENRLSVLPNLPMTAFL